MAEIQDKDAEIAAMAKLAVLLKADITGKDAEIEQLKALCTRAADTLDKYGLSDDQKEFIAELRKAAQ